jgi:uncharacterized protein
MYFVVLCRDKPQSLSIRTSNRDAHLAYLRKNETQIRVAGPFLDGDGTMVGSMLIIRAETEADVRALLVDDPYAQANLFAEVQIQPWRWVIGEPRE